MSLTSSRKKYVLANGMKIVHEHRFDQNCSMFSLYLNTGSALENKKQKGIAHLVEHLMFKSTNKMSAIEISKELEKYGAVVNAATSFDSIVFHFKVLNEYFTKCLSLFSDMLLNKNITQAEFETEKAIVLQELGMYEDYPEDKCQNAHYRSFFGLDPVIGYRDIIKNITLSDVMQFIRVYLVPSNITISVVSNKFHATILRLIKKYLVRQFETLSTESTTTQWETLVTSKPVLQYKNKINVVVDKTSQTQIMYQIPINVEKKDYAKARYLAHLYSSGLSSILYRELREKLGLCYGVHTSFNYFDNKQMGYHFGKCLTITSSVEAKNTWAFIDRLTYVLNNIDNFITNEDILRVNNNYKAAKTHLDDYVAYNYDTFDCKYCKKLDDVQNKLKHMTIKKVKKLINNAFGLEHTSIKHLTTVLGNLKKNDLKFFSNYTIIKPVKN